jgi:hypothetical protein
MNVNLKPCIVFDLDDTLFETANIDWHSPKEECFEKLSKASIIPIAAFTYQAMDYMVNDPPSWVEEGMGWPKDIVFSTARPEIFREVTIESLMSLTGECETYLNRRLFMRPHNSDTDLTHDLITTPYQAKAYNLMQIREKGYNPVLALDNCCEAVRAYLDGGVPNILKTILSEVDKKKALSP